MAKHGPDEYLADVEASFGADLDAVTVYNLVRTQSYLAPFIDSGLRRENLTAAQFNALLVLQVADEDGLLMGQIGDRLVVTRANVTGLVDRLERQGLVARDKTADRRATMVSLTDAGCAILKDTLPHYSRLAAQLTAGLTEREKRTLVRLLSKLRRELRRQRRKMAADPASTENPTE